MAMRANTDSAAPRVGPTQPGDGPTNPDDALRTGALGTRHFSDQTQRRPFSIPTKASCYRRESPSNDEWNQPGWEEGVGEDANKYSKGENPATTLNGQPIRGT